jgi:hypothetical protein
MPLLRPGRHHDSRGATSPQHLRGAQRISTGRVGPDRVKDGSGLGLIDDEDIESLR